MDNITKYQHIIPAWYIAQFSYRKSAPLRKSPIYVYDKRASKILHTTAERFLGEDFYFEIRSALIALPERVNLVEKELQRIEWAFLSLLDSKLSVPDSILSQEDINLLRNYIIHLRIRSERKRREIHANFEREMDEKYSTMDAIQKQKEYMGSLGRDASRFDKINSHEWRSEIAKMLHSASVLGYMQDEDPLYQAESQRFTGYLYRISRTHWGKEFISSDNPVTFKNQFIFFPLTKNACLVWFPETGSVQLPQDSDTINCCIAANAQHVTFGSSKELIEEYKDLVWTAL